MRLRPFLLALVPFVIAACGDSSSTTAVPIESTTFAASLGVNLAASTKTASGLYIRDIRPGTGATLVAGTHVSVKYSGALANGTVFDSGTYPFILGTGAVIQGWDEGLLGMKVGGSRQLVIPSQLGYGAQGSGPIPPNAVLVFTVEPQ
jgi:FKBP-type peptidyl-prolyl cis-trans isomerase FkpA